MASLVAGLFVKTWLSGSLLVLAVLTVGFVIYRLRLLWYMNVPVKGVKHDRPLRWSAVTTVVLMASVYFTVTSLPPDPPSTVQVQQPDPNAGVIACTRAHNMKGAYKEWPPKKVTEDWGGQPPTASEQEYLQSLPGTALYITVYSWCNWPRPPWAQADGYTEITLTELQGPDHYAAELDSAERIKAPCQKLKMAFTLHYWDAMPLPPMTLRTGTLVDLTGNPWPSESDRKYTVFRSNFSPERDEVVVVHTGHAHLDYVKCVS